MSEQPTTMVAGFLGFAETFYEHDLAIAEAGIRVYRAFLEQAGYEAPELPESLVANVFWEMRAALDELTRLVREYEAAALRGIPYPVADRPD